jgi:transcription elongation factor GreB
LEDENGEINRYRIVGPDEIDPKLGYISMDSPVAKLLMKKTVNDEIVVVTPGGETELYIKAVQYEPFE